MTTSPVTSKHNNGRSFRWLVLIILLGILVRHFWLAAFVHPYADDFSYAVVGMRTGLLERLLHEYTSWNGRYFSNILVLRNPMILGLGDGLVLYRVVPVALMVLTLAGAFSLVRAVVGELLPQMEAFIVALVLVLLYLHIMPDASEGIYWYTGAVTYQLPSALSLFLLANWICYFKSQDGPVKKRIMIVQAVLVMVIAGCNEVHMGFMLLLHMSLVSVDLASDKKLDKVLLVMAGISVICALVVGLAPGNAVRGSHFPDRHDVWLTLSYSIAQTGRFIGAWIFLSPLLVFSLFVPGWARWLADRSPWVRRSMTMNKWLALALPAVVVFVPMVLAYWPTGLLGQYRTVNVACFYFIPAWSMAIAVWDQQYFRHRAIFLPMPEHKFAGALLIMLLASVLFTGRDLDLNNDLLTGRVARYDAAVDQRYDLIEAAVMEGIPEVVLPELTYPRSLKILPLDTVSVHWMNTSMADYFGNPGLQLIAPRAPRGSAD